MKCRNINNNLEGDTGSVLAHSSSEAVLAVALSMCKEGKRLQLTQLVCEQGSFQAARQFISNQEVSAAHIAYEGALGQGIDVIALTHPRYPTLLRQINAPPPVLYVRQRREMRDFGQASIAIVGTRAAGIEECEEARQMGQDLSCAGHTVVSGLALGIDGAAHRGALCSETECPTIAVLAHGLDRTYPPSHRGLAEMILERGGMIVSEYPPGVEPRRHHFLARNRIIAGLVRGVVVVQAGARSGSLVTASFAADYGRDVFVLQHDAGDERSAGSESLIEQGAIPIRGAAAVLNEYGGQHRDTCDQFESGWRIISIEELVHRAKLSNADLLRWELDGRLVMLPGNRVRVLGV
jgi:DNA processing protein